MPCCSYSRRSLQTWGGLARHRFSHMYCRSIRPVYTGIGNTDAGFVLGTGKLLLKDAQLFFRGQQIWLAGMEELMSQGMHNADQALLSGCSAGGLASILHCDEFRDLLMNTTKVKCLSDAGMFLDANDVSGGHTLRNMFEGVVNLQRLQNNLPKTCTNHFDPTSCFFPQNLIANVKTPLFLLNAAYDAWQHQLILMAIGMTGNPTMHVVT